MSTRQVVTITDDLDGTEGATPVAFGLDGAALVIDLAPEHERALREALAPFIAHGRRLKPGVRPRPRRRAPEPPPASAVAPQETAIEPPVPDGTPLDLAALSNADVRAWCKAQGIDVSERGRVPLALKTRYLSAVGTTAMGAQDGGDAQP